LKNCQRRLAWKKGKGGVNEGLDSELGIGQASFAAINQREKRNLIKLAVWVQCPHQLLHDMGGFVEA